MSGAPSIRPEKIEELIARLGNASEIARAAGAWWDNEEDGCDTAMEMASDCDDFEKLVLDAKFAVASLKAENDGLRKAVERLGSSEAFTLSQHIPDNALGKELLARIDFARAFLTAQEESEP